MCVILGFARGWLIELPHILYMFYNTTTLQYGFVNSALEKLIKRRFGVEKWEEIRYTL